jgi:hypothetical protein
MQQHHSIVIHNDRSRPYLVWIEPWGEDYTLLPQQRLIVTSTVSSPIDRPAFALVESDTGTQLYIETGNYPELLVDGIPVVCGHSRQAAIDAGLWT